MATIPKFNSSELMVSILFVPQCISTVLTNFGSVISLTSHTTFSARSLPTPKLTVLFLNISLREYNFIINNINQKLKMIKLRSKVLYHKFQ